METSVLQPSGDSVIRLRELLRDSPEPLTAKTLQASLGLKAKSWKATVEEALRGGFAKAWPKSRFWHLGQEEAIAARVPRLLAVLREAAAPVTEEQIATALGVTPKEAKQVVKKALADGALRKWPKSRYWYQDEEQAVREFVFARLREAPLPASVVAPPFASSKALAKVLKGLVASQEIVLAYMLPVAQTAAPSQASELLAAVQKLQRAPGVPVSVQELRAAAPMAKADFDRAALELAGRQLVYLTTHDHGWALPESDRAVLIHDGGKKLYVAVTLRD